MTAPSMNLIVGLVAGAGVFIFFAGLAVHLASARWQARLRANVGAYAGPGTIAAAGPSGADDLTERLNDRLRKLSFMPRLRAQLVSSGIAMPASRFLLLEGAVVLIGAFLGLILLASLPAPVRLLGMALSGAGAYLIIRFFLRFKRSRRLRALETLLPDTVDVLAGALEAGSSLSQSMAMAAREMDEPIAGELSRVVLDQELGLSQQESLERWLERCPSSDLDMLITAINIQYRVGGNLSQVLRVISHTIRERLRIRREIRILTAQGRTSAKIITVVPFALTGIIYVVNPEYISVLWTTNFGRILIGVALTMIAIGYFIMNRIVSIEV